MFLYLLGTLTQLISASGIQGPCLFLSGNIPLHYKGIT